MLSDEVKTGQVDHKLWIAIEDIHDGWEKSGEVGQEVYGAGVAFGIVPRHFYRVPNESFMIFCDYPTAEFKHRKGTVTFKIKGDEQLSCRLMIIKKDKTTLPDFTITDSNGELKGIYRKDGHKEFMVNGNQQIKIKWTP
jgi:hypothetical protein